MDLKCEYCKNKTFKYKITNLEGSLSDHKLTCSEFMQVFLKNEKSSFACEDCKECIGKQPQQQTEGEDHKHKEVIEDIKTYLATISDEEEIRSEVVNGVLMVYPNSKLNDLQNYKNCVPVVSVQKLPKTTSSQNDMIDDDDDEVDKGSFHKGVDKVRSLSCLSFSSWTSSQLFDDSSSLFNPESTMVDSDFKASQHDNESLASTSTSSAAYDGLTKRYSILPTKMKKKIDVKYRVKQEKSDQLLTDSEKKTINDLIKRTKNDEETTFECIECKFTSSNRKVVVKHVMRMHMNKVSYEFNYSRLIPRLATMGKIHKKCFECLICREIEHPISYESRAEIEDHLRQHEKRKVLHCVKNKLNN